MAYYDRHYGRPHRERIRPLLGGIASFIAWTVIPLIARIVLL